MSEFGCDVVREMNRLGIIVGVNHISDEAFWDVLEASQASVIATHSSTRHFTPGWPRNKSVEMIEAMAKRGMGASDDEEERLDTEGKKSRRSRHHFHADREAVREYEQALAHQESTTTEQ